MWTGEKRVPARHSPLFSMAIAEVLSLVVIGTRFAEFLAVDSFAVCFPAEASLRSWRATGQAQHGLLLFCWYTGCPQFEQQRRAVKFRPVKFFEAFDQRSELTATQTLCCRCDGDSWPAHRVLARGLTASLRPLSAPG